MTSEEAADTIWLMLCFRSAVILFLIYQQFSLCCTEIISTRFRFIDRRRLGETENNVRRYYFLQANARTVKSTAATVTG